jgi:hypothetical protein
MPSKRLQMTARISAQPFDAHRDDVGRRAFHRTLTDRCKATTDLRSSCVTTRAAKFERLGHQRRLEVDHAQAAGHHAKGGGPLLRS